jgi:tetratricopeptide (TPR) repeat protein
VEETTQKDECGRETLFTIAETSNHQSKGLKLREETLTGNIFISYRREDSAAYAGRLCDQLTAVFGERRVFMDVEDIPPGQNFAQAIEEKIANCCAVLVIIGPRWIEILRRRSNEHQEDYVCREIQEALQRKAIIIPVLVGGANMAQLTDLPPGLTELHFHQAAELRDDTFKEDCARLANALSVHPGLEARPSKKTARNSRIAWIGGFTTLLALLLAIASLIGIGPWSSYRAQKSRVHQLLNTAQTQINQAEYEPAFKTYETALKLDPGNRTAMDRQVDAAMLWLQNFHVIVGEGQKVEDLAGPSLSEIMSVLDSGLARTSGHGERAADILAHLGWAHWLNQHIAEKEFGPAAEQDLRRALSIDPQNVYGNAMLGNWLLQTRGSLDEALRHFNVALKSSKQRALVREMQLGGMIYNESLGVRPALIRVANQMRINSEPLGEPYKHRILSNYSPLNSREELTETLSAVPPDEAWATFLWLDDKPATGDEPDEQRIQREFIHASILETAGKSAEALTMFRTLQRELKQRGSDGRISDHVAMAIKRLQFG